MYRFYANQVLEVGKKISLSEEELHHAVSVLRVKQGEEIEIVNGGGVLAYAVFTSPLQVARVKHSPPPHHKKILMQSYPQGTHLELIVEKGTELGITDFCLFPSEKSPFKVLSEARKGRLKKITIAALKQCKRLFLPTLSFYSNIDEMSFPTTILLADPTGEAYTKPSGDSAFIVGPESGFTPAEIDFFIKKKKATPVKISDNILRCETAAIVAASLL